MQKHKLFKEGLHLVIMKKGGVSCSSCISLNQLGLNMNNPLMKCCNSKRVTLFSNSPKIIAMVRG